MKRTFVVLAALACGVPAQNLVTVPSGYDVAEGDSRTTVPGIGRTGAKQWLIGSGHLANLRGQTITGLSFRHDANWNESAAPGSADLVVRIGIAAVEPLDATSNPAVNLPPAGSLEVFRGNVSFAASTVVAGAAPWSSPHVIEVPFAIPFLYSAGPLAIEIDGVNTASTTAWSIDGVEDSIAGTLIHIGMGCGPRGFANGHTGFADDCSFVLGGSADFSLYGQDNAAALLLIGATVFPNPINLAVLGAPTCELHVDAFATISRPVVESNLVGVGGVARALIPLPSQPVLLGGALYAQWFEIGAVITTSQAMRFQIAPRMPNLDMTTLIRHADGTVEIRPRFAPVFGFRCL